jgi:hypothetical protein
MQHGKVACEMFPDYTIDIHPNVFQVATWAAILVLIRPSHPLGSNVAMDIPECKIAEADLRREL